MGRPFREKYANIKWEVNEEHFNAWKEGKTGVPIVDAGMRQLNAMGEPLPTRFYVLKPSAGTTRHLGWMHNRVRMIVAMYLTKDLMLDWRLGERVRSSTSLVLEVFGMFDVRSTSRRCSSIPTSPLTTEVGNGAPELGRTLNRTLGYSIHTTKAKRCERRVERRGHYSDIHLGRPNWKLYSGVRS